MKVDPLGGLRLDKLAIDEQLSRGYTSYRTVTINLGDESPKTVSRGQQHGHDGHTASNSCEVSAGRFHCNAQEAHVAL